MSDSAPENALFASYFAASLFAIVTVFYFIQAVLAYLQARTPQKVKMLDGNEAETTLFSAFKYFDEGISNSIWAFLILGIFLPMVLTSLSNIVPILHGKITSTDGQLQISRPAASAYYICIALISVLITLEFSYIHNLRRRAPEWVPFLLVALVLDLTTLLVIIFAVTPPVEWKINPSGITRIMMLFTVIFALISTFGVLVLARTASALHDGLIDFSNEDQNEHDVEKGAVDNEAHIEHLENHEKVTGVIKK